MRNIVILLVSTVALSSCIYKDPKPTKISGMNEDIMMNQVNGKVNDGDIDINHGPYLGDGNLGGSTGDPTNSPQQKSLPDQVYGLKKGNGYQVATPSAGQPVRYADSIQKVYIFPYKDRYGNYYDSQIMYTVLDKSHWVGYPVDKISSEDYDFSAIEEQQ